MTPKQKKNLRDQKEQKEAPIIIENNQIWLYFQNKGWQFYEFVMICFDLIITPKIAQPDKERF